MTVQTKKHRMNKIVLILDILNKLANLARRDRYYRITHVLIGCLNVIRDACLCGGSATVWMTAVTIPTRSVASCRYRNLIRLILTIRWTWSVKSTSLPVHQVSSFVLVINWSNYCKHQYIGGPKFFDLVIH